MMSKSVIFLKFKETGDEFEVIEIDLDARFTPVRVAMTSDYATTELVSGIFRFRSIR